MTLPQLNDTVTYRDHPERSDSQVRSGLVMMVQAGRHGGAPQLTLCHPTNPGIIWVETLTDDMIITPAA